MSKYLVQYMSGIPRQPVPKPQTVSVERDGLKIFKQLIRWQDMTNIAINNSVGGNGFSVGKAIAGDMLAGGIGALAGGMSGKRKFDTFVQISYTLGSETNALVLMPKGNIKVQEKFINTLMDKYGKEPVVKQNRREQLALTPEAIAARKARIKERNERQKEQLKTLAAVPSKLLAKLRQK